MRKLYITDLDGTLLDAKAQISRYSEMHLIEFIKEGMALTVATGRTPLSVIPILRNIPIQLPVILMNGGAVYDMNRKKCLCTNPIVRKSVEYMCMSEEKAGIKGMYIISVEGSLEYYMSESGTRALEEYLGRTGAAEREAIQRRNLEEAQESQKQLLYALYMDNHPERLQELYDALAEDTNLTLDFYKDIYTSDEWCLEVMSARSTKAAALLQLKQQGGYDWMVGFGDSWNDMSLFEVCDEKYAVANAATELKQAADAVIGSNLEDGVVRCLLKVWKNRENVCFAENERSENEI